MNFTNFLIAISRIVFTVMYQNMPLTVIISELENSIVKLKRYETEHETNVIWSVGKILEKEHDIFGRGKMFEMLKIFLQLPASLLRLWSASRRILRTREQNRTYTLHTVASICIRYM
jgi:hypothetical protein